MSSLFVFSFLSWDYTRFLKTDTCVQDLESTCNRLLAKRKFMPYIVDGSMKFRCIFRPFLNREIQHVIAYSSMKFRCSQLQSIKDLLIITISSYCSPFFLYSLLSLFLIHILIVVALAFIYLKGTMSFQRLIRLILQLGNRHDFLFYLYILCMLENHANSNLLSFLFELVSLPKTDTMIF